MSETTDMKLEQTQQPEQEGQTESQDQKEPREVKTRSLDEDDELDRKINLVSSDGHTFPVNIKYAKISVFVTSALEDDDEAIDIPVLSVDKETLALVVEFMNHHEGTEPERPEKPLRHKEMSQVCNDPWDAEFIDRVDQQYGRQQLYNVILAANYMDIKSLLHIACAKVASLIKGQPLEKIKVILDPNSQEQHDEGESDLKSNEMKN